MRYLLLVIVLLSGCSSMPRGEWAYQGLHFVDTLQTLNAVAYDDCYEEIVPLTRMITGEKPSDGQVIAWGVGLGAAHYGISRVLEDKAPPWALATWQIVTTGDAGITVFNNYKVGMRLWGDNDHSKLDNWCAGN